MKKNTRKIAVLVAVSCLIILFWAFDLRQYLTLSYIKESLDRFEMLYSHHPAAVIAAYMAIYILATSLSLPGAAVLTIAGGALFGLWTGTLVVSFASTTGATLACAVSRFILRDWVQNKFSQRLSKVNEGIAREGIFYLFTLRLIPVFPFWMINLLMGLTKMPLFKFYLVSQVGMLPGTLVYVNAGREIARIESLKGILSPGLILSFVLIGIFPIAAKKVVSYFRERRGKAEIRETINR
ncbi:MAG: TVP38/TMEM64 family protein [Nitrospirota bacterium]